MPSHYVGFSLDIEKHARRYGAARPDWRQEVFCDIAGADRRIRIFPSPTHNEEARIGIVGERFLVYAVRHAHRTDSVFVHRIERSRANLQSLEVELDLRFLPDRPSAERLDDPEHLFRLAVAPMASETPHVQSPTRKLRTFLQRLPTSTRVSLAVERKLEPTELLSLSIQTWKRHQLRRFVNPPPITERERWLLDGRVVGRDAQEIIRLREVFSIDLLNRFVAASVTPDEVAKLLSDLASGLLLPQVGFALWCASWSALGPAAVVQEVHAAVHLNENRIVLAEEHAPFARRVLIESLRDVASEHPSALIMLDLIARIEASDDPVSVLKDWSTTVQVATVPTVSVDEGGLAEAAIAQESDGRSATPVGDESEQVEQSRQARQSAFPAARTESAAFDAWVLDQLAVPIDNVGMRSQPLQEVTWTLLEILTSTPSIHSVDHLLGLFDVIRSSVAAFEQHFPNRSLWQAFVGRAMRARDQLQSLLGDAGLRILTSKIRLDDVEAALAVLAQRQVLEALPDWLVPDIDNSEAVSGVDARVVQLFSCAVLRDRTLLLSQKLSELGPHFCLADIPLLLAPASIQDGCSTGSDSSEEVLQEHIERQVDELAAWRYQVSELHPNLQDLAKRLAPKGDKPNILAMLQISTDLIETLSPQTVRDILDDLALHDPAVSRRHAQAFVNAVTLYTRKTLRPASAATFDALSALADLTPAIADQAACVRMEHPRFGEEGHRPRLHALPREGQPYATITAPLKLVSSEPLDIDTKLAWRYGAHTPSMPQALPQGIRVSRGEWKERERGFEFDFMLTMAVTRTPQSTIKVSVSSDDSRLAPRDLEWDDVEIGPPTFGLEWSNAPDADYVERHAVGPQTRKQRYLERLRSGSSFAVIAPRRFGKTTLLNFLRKQGESTGGVCVLDSIDCNGFVSAGFVDYGQFWRKVSALLQARTRAGIVSTEERVDLPEADAFVDVRISAAERGYDNVVILLDEAQALFPLRGGTDFGSRLKGLLHSLGTRSEVAGSRCATISFVLVGLPCLRERGGDNLMGLLSPNDSWAIAESDLNAVILRRTSDALQTTREARLRLASLGLNLEVLRSFIEGLIERCRKAARSWATSDDVDELELVVIRDLRSGAAETIASFLRDSFNAVEGTRTWVPIATFPVAVALANARAVDRLRTESDLVDRVSAILNEWASQLGAGGDPILERASFDTAAVGRHLTTLRSDAIVNGVAFRSSLMEAWLRSPTLGQSSEFGEALVAAGIPTIELPDTIVWVAEGGQARVGRFTQEGHGGATLAYREVPLADSEARARFLESRAMLMTLKRRVENREPNSEHVFDLRAVGLRRDGDQAVGVHVYRWIEGFDLSTRLGKLPASMVVDLGTRLARTVEWLHSTNVLHRDIHPRNIVVEHLTMRPVLIDFGLARQGDTVTMKTGVFGDFAAPEVRSRRAAWSRAADVWSLGRSLGALLNCEHDSPELRQIIAKAQAQRPDDRPLAGEIADVLERVRLQLGVESLYAGVRRRFLELGGTDYASLPYFRSILEKHADTAKVIICGGFPDFKPRAWAAADFLNQVLEAWAAASGHDRISLGSAAHHNNNVTGDRLVLESVRVAAALRNVRSHGVHPPVPDDQLVRGQLLEAAQAVGGVVGVQCLRTITRTLLDGAFQADG